MKNKRTIATLILCTIMVMMSLAVSANPTNPPTYPAYSTSLEEYENCADELQLAL